MERLPDALFVIDTGYEKIAIAEARKLGIPIVAVVDSNNSPQQVDYVIPGNDDAVRAIQLYVDAAAESIQAGKTSGAISGSKEYVEVKETAAEPAAATAETAAAEAEASLAAAASDAQSSEAASEAPAVEASPEASASEKPADT